MTRIWKRISGESRQAQKGRESAAFTEDFERKLTFSETMLASPIEPERYPRDEEIEGLESDGLRGGRLALTKRGKRGGGEKEGVCGELGAELT